MGSRGSTFSKTGGGGTPDDGGNQSVSKWGWTSYYKAVTSPQLRPLHICSQVPGWALTRASQLFPIKIHGHGSKIVIQVGRSSIEVIIIIMILPGGGGPGVVLLVQAGARGGPRRGRGGPAGAGPV